MCADKNDIIIKVRELSEMIEKHRITRTYYELRERINNDRISQDLLSKLIMLGEETSQKIQHGEHVTAETSAEHEFLKKKLDENETVKQFIIAQKEYLKLLELVTIRIKDPQ